ncbi:hypothetical protein SAMN04488074_12155 [Lentzea albidocapillata subsp. violacea]|uniref:Uncharacterized protein n=1 Tax=Lentzea albidocapillata subsp. violacea TaxID=128104 RepID=A0A1G9T293_9PSEU|nr:hypothetical protein [Lentzea albidocapillata]SDM41770.1 hypothetical protein SAMN04488074_12155 [Lentzea albidocapillata subsp. violacea]
MQNNRRELAWLWGPVALVLLALFNVSDHALLSTHGAHFGVSKYSVATLGLPAIAVIAGVWLTRHWQWLLVLGSAGVLVASVESQVHIFSLRPGTSGIIDALGVAGAVLIVIGVLAVTRDAAMAATVVGVQVLATLFRGMDWLDSTIPPTAVVFALAGLGVLGAVLAVHAVHTDKAPRSEPISRRAAISGTAAALLPLVLLGAGILLQQELVLPLARAAAGVALLLCTAGLTLALGRGAFLRTMTAGLVLLAVAAPLNFGLYFSASQFGTYAPAAVVGLGAGILAAQLGRSTVAGTAACAVLAAVMGLVAEVTGSYSDMTHSALGSLIVALGVLAVTSAVAAATPALVDLRALPVALGPLLIGFTLAFRQLVQPWLAYEKSTTQFPEQYYISVWVVLLVLAALALAVGLYQPRERHSGSEGRSLPSVESSP